MTNTIPSTWLPKCTIKRIIVHWTAGGRIATALDAQHYHFLLNQDLTIRKGIDVQKNARDGLGKLTPGADYAAHTKGANSFSIGFAFSGMRGATEKPWDGGPDPLTEPQWSRGMQLLAQICEAYGIQPEPKTLLTHAEVQDNLGIKQNGKWDIARLPFQTDKAFDTPKEVGDLMRSEVRFIIGKGKK
jgi:N-acetyl-anhydromuramyl-L-alanine amidase AmpD